MNYITRSTILLSLFASSSTWAINLYSTEHSSLNLGGQIEPRFNISDANKMTGNSSFDDLSRILLNIYGETTITDDLSVLANYQGQFNSGNNSSTVSSLYMYVGLESKTYGTLSYGQQDSAQVILTDATNIMETFGGSAANIINANNDELENNFVYSIKLPQNITATINYINDDVYGNETTGGSFLYSAPYGIQFGAGYVAGKQNAVDVNQYNIALSYSLDALYLGGLYVAGEINKIDVEGFELAAAYTIKDTILRYVFNYRKSDFTAPQSALYSVKYHAVEAQYNITDDITAYAGYEFNLLDGQQNDDQFQAGIIYGF